MPRAGNTPGTHTPSSAPYPLAGRCSASRGCFGFVSASSFVLYHLCYENILHQTDGMEYLSDWTFVLLGLVFGLLAWHLAPASAGPKLTELTVVLHGVCWSTNIVSTFGAWYSFLFFPQCESLEGVDNYPDCYLEWYRFTEHGLNMLILFGDYAVGLVPVRRKDYGYSILFLSVYAMWSWYLWFHVGKCPYVMFDFNAGWSSVPWYASSYAGLSAAFFLIQRLYAARDARRVGASGALGGDGILPGHVKVNYNAVRDDGGDEYD